MRTLPTGTVTFLFSDIEGSTRLAQRLGAQWSEVLAEHRALLRESFTAHGGVEAGTEGDSFFVAFPTPSAAAAAAVDIQRRLELHEWPDGIRLRVRIGLHTAASAEIAEGSYAGVDVHLAARIMSAGHGGQILLSSTTRPLIQGALPAGSALKALGEHRLKDIGQPQELTQLCVTELQTEFPPLRTVDVVRTNLPEEATTFVGREEEVARVRELLADNRLVTLTGPGGTGKTRLSLRVARGELGAHPDGVWFVPLAAIREPELVLPAIGKAIGVGDVGADPIQRLTEALAGKRMLVVLDNLEQVIEVAPDLSELIKGTADVRMLATSRSPLRVYGEQEFGVPPLPMPDPRKVPADRTIVEYAAAALFRERARRVKPDFEVTDDNAPAVAEICWRLDGLPLAIELAAARIRILTPQAIVGRLSRRLDLGTGGARDLTERQQTLRGAIAWSYDILDERERPFFAAFSVFAGGTDLQAAEAVLADQASDVVEALEAMVDKSLIRQEELADGTPRFRMLETIREYAQERLAERPDDADRLRRKHAEHYLGRAAATAARVMTDDQRSALDRAELDYPNLRAALAWATDAGEAELAMRMVTASWRMWQMRGYLGEGEERARRVLDMAGLDAHPALLADFLEAAGGIAYWQGDFPLARSRYSRALEIQRRIGDDAAVANAIYNEAMSWALGGERIPVEVPPDVVAKANEALAIYRRIGDRQGEGRVLWALLDYAVLQLRPDEALETGEQCLRIFEESGDRFMLGWTEYMLALNENLRGERTLAYHRYRRALDTFTAARDVSGYALVLDGIASILFSEGHRTLAMRLAGGSDALQRQSGIFLARMNRNWAQFFPEQLKEDDPELAAAWNEGRAMSLDGLLALVDQVTHEAVTPSR